MRNITCVRLCGGYEIYAVAMCMFCSGSRSNSSGAHPQDGLAPTIVGTSCGGTARISSFRVVQDVRLHPENLKGAVAMIYRAGYIFVVKTEKLV